MSADDFDARARWLAACPPPVEPTGPTAIRVPPDHEVCDICTDVFWVGPEGTPTLTYDCEDGEVRLVACPECVMAAIETD